MIGVVLTMPDDPATLPTWLEERLLSPDLPQLVAELTVLHGQPADTQGAKLLSSLADVLGRDADSVLDLGLTALPRARLSQMLRQPKLLLELRDLVLSAGGRYWDQGGSNDDLARRAVHVAGRVRATVALVPPNAQPRTTRRGWTYAVTAMAAAAAVLFVVYLLGFRPPDRTTPQLTAANWGFARLNKLPRDAGDAAVLAKLADLAAEWSKTRPESAEGLAQRLGQFRQGCAALQLADNLPLSAPQRQWLRLRCGDWAAAFDAHLRRLEETHDVAGVQAAADKTADRIAQELRERSHVARRAAA